MQDVNGTTSAVRPSASTQVCVYVCTLGFIGQGDSRPQEARASVVKIPIIL